MLYLLDYVNVALQKTSISICHGNLPCGMRHLTPKIYNQECVFGENCVTAELCPMRNQISALGMMSHVEMIQNCGKPHLRLWTVLSSDLFVKCCAVMSL